ncbi:MAG: DMT family transporter [Flavobacteriales bacterium]
MNSYKKNLLVLHVTVLIFGLTGIFGKLLEGLGALNTVFYRVLIGALGMLAYAIWTKRSLKLASVKQLLKLAGVGAIISAHWFFFFESINVSNVSIALATISTTSLFVSLFQPLLTHRSLVGYEIVLGLLVIAGLMVILGYEFQYWKGIVYSLIAAALAAVFSLLNSNFIQSEDSLRISFYEIASGALILCIVLASTSTLVLPQEISAEEWLWIVLLGIVATSFAFIASVEVMKVLSPFTVSLTINLEPIYSIILALLIFKDDEHMSAQFYVGALIIIATLFINAYLKKKERKKKTPLVI